MCWSGYSINKDGQCIKCDDENAVYCSHDGKVSYECKEDITKLTSEIGFPLKNYALNNKKCEQVNNHKSIQKIIML